MFLQMMLQGSRYFPSLDSTAVEDRRVFCFQLQKRKEEWRWNPPPAWKWYTSLPRTFFWKNGNTSKCKAGAEKCSPWLHSTLPETGPHTRGWGGGEGVWGRRVGVGSMSNCHCHWLCLDIKSLCKASFSHFNCSHWSPKLNPCTQLKFLEFKPSGVYMAYCDLNKKTCHLPPPSAYPCAGWGSITTSRVHKREEWKTQQTLVPGENSCPAVGRSLDEPQFCSCGLSALPTVASSVPWKLCPCLPSFTWTHLKWALGECSLLACFFLVQDERAWRLFIKHKLFVKVQDYIDSSFDNTVLSKTW